MASNRELAIKRHENLYTRFYHNPTEKFVCFYCGGPGQCFDHVPPITRVADYESLQLLHPRYVKVVSCLECNTLAADSLQDSVLDRWAFIKRQLRRKHRSILSAPDWTPEDCEEAELGPRLRSFVEARQLRLEAILERLDYSAGIQAYVDRFEDD